MHKQAAYTKYKQVQVGTANRGKLLIMLYQGCIKFLRLAVKSIETGDVEIANNYLIKSQDIIDELINSLNMANGGKIVENLYLLYDFMKNQLVEANIHKNKDKITVVIKMLEELLESWQEVAKEKKTV